MSKKKTILAFGCLVALVFLVAAAWAGAYTVTETKYKDLPLAGMVEATTSLSATDGEAITVSLTDDGPYDVTITGLEFLKGTPKPNEPGGGISGVAIAPGGKSVVATVSQGGKETLHLSLRLSTGEKIGVNVHF